MTGHASGITTLAPLSAYNRAPVEIQDFATQHLYSQIEYAEAQGSVVDRRGQIGTAMSKHLGLSDTSMDPTAAEVVSDGRRDQYRVGIAQIYASLVTFSDFEGARDHTRDFLEFALGLVGKPELESTTVRSYDIAPVDNFDLLRDRLANRLTTGIDGLSIGFSLSDIAWVLEFGGEHESARVQFGPMKDKQLKGLLRASEDAAVTRRTCCFLTSPSKGSPQNPLGML